MRGSSAVLLAAALLPRAAAAVTLTPSLGAFTGSNDNVYGVPQEIRYSSLRVADSFVRLQPALRVSGGFAPGWSAGLRYGLEMDRYAKVTESDGYTHAVLGDVRWGGGGAAATLSGGWQNSLLPGEKDADNRAYLNSSAVTGALTAERAFDVPGRPAVQGGASVLSRRYPRYPVVSDASDLAKNEPRRDLTAGGFAGGSWCPAAWARLSAAWQAADNRGNALLDYHLDGRLRDYFSYAGRGGVLGAAFAPSRSWRADLGVQYQHRAYADRRVVADPARRVRADIVSAGAAGMWFVNRGAAIVLEDRYVGFGSNDPRVAFTDNLVTLGVRLAEEFRF